MKSSQLVSMIGAIFLAGSLSAWAQKAPVAPDNSGVNQRDRNSAAITADQQSNSKSDVELTRQIRRSLEKDSSLSSMAHNVKIISDDGNVVLRGPVKTTREKRVIGAKAEWIAGADKVDNELEVKEQ
jgi:osmotically-inducible protein OsmY